MKRLALSAVAATLLGAGMAGQVQAQDMAGRRASQFDLGIYGGGAYTTDWFTTPEQGDEEEGWTPGFSSIFGGLANFWFTPSLGLRLHGAYMPQKLPQAEGFESDALVTNSYLYDLNLVFRPFFSASEGIMPSVYFFLGGGGYTADIGDFMTPGVADDEIRCIPAAVWLSNGVCVSTHRDYATVGQGTVGVGADFFPFGPVTLFGEVAVHGYDSPAHVVNENARGEDKFTFTPRAVLGLKALFGDILPPPPVVETPPPPPVVVEPAPPVVVPPTPPTMQDIRVCVVQDGNLTELSAQYNPTAGDTTVNGQPFGTVHPMGSQYAANATWFINNEPVMFQNRRFVKYGLPRVLGVSEVTRVGEFQGVSLFAEAGQTRPDVVYVPVRPGCEFQPYQVEVKTGSVRGE